MDNPYALEASDVEEPPRSFRGVLKHLGPGFILSASIVGSGELISTTLLGAEAGFVTLWVVLVSCLVKVTVQLEFGKHAIYSGETTFTAFNKLPGLKLGRANWSIWTWLLLMTLKFLQVGGIIGGVAIILLMAFPQLSLANLGFLPEAVTANLPESAIWALLLAPCVSLLVFRGWYTPIERISLIMIGLFTLLTLASVYMLHRTEYAVSMGEIASGLTFDLPKFALAAAIGAFGITGVGGDEVMMYNYWLVEKGYAAKTGPREDSEAWTRRAKGWIRVMYVDALLAMVAYTIVTAAFYILGAAVLNAQGLIPDKKEIIDVLSKMYTDTLGPGARNIFLAGAFVVLFSTLLSALAGWTRLFGDAFSQLTNADFKNEATRRKLVAVLAWIIPVLWALLFLFFKSPGLMVMLGGIATSLILLIVLFAAFHFKYRRLPAELKPGPVYNVAFWASAISIVAVGVYGIVKLF